MQNSDAKSGEYGDHLHTVLMILTYNLPDLVHGDHDDLPDLVQLELCQIHSEAAKPRVEFIEKKEIFICCYLFNRNVILQ